MHNILKNTKLQWMDEILHQLGWLKPYRYGINHPWTGAGFRNQPQYQTIPLTFGVILCRPKQRLIVGFITFFSIDPNNAVLPNYVLVYEAILLYILISIMNHEPYCSYWSGFHQIPLQGVLHRRRTRHRKKRSWDKIEVTADKKWVRPTGPWGVDDAPWVMEQVANLNMDHRNSWFITWKEGDLSH